MESLPDTKPGPIVVAIELQLQDLQALQHYLHSRILGHWKVRASQVAIWFGLFVATVLTFLALPFFNTRPHLPSMLIGVVLCALAILTILRMNSRFARPTVNSASLGPMRMRFDPAGVHIEREWQSGFTAWKKVEQIDQTGDHIFMPLDPLMAFLVPKRYLTTLSVEEFLASVRQWHAARAAAPAAESAVAPATVPAAEAIAEAQTAVTTIASRPAAVPEPSFWSGLRANLRAGIRMALFRRVEPSDFVATFGQVFTLLVIALAVAAILDRASAVREAEFYYYSVYSWITCILGGLWVCALVARISSPRSDTRQLLTAMLAVAPYALALIWLLSLLPLDISEVRPTPLFAALVVLVATLRAIRATQGFVHRASFGVALAASLGLGFAILYGYIYTPLWQEIQEESEEWGSGEWEGTESTLFDQPQRIADAIDELEPERPGVSDVFYVGFAGDGSQGVFRREALFGKRAFAERMGSGTRSLDLINDNTDRIAYPLGTTTGLRYGLQHLAERMNKDEDLLVLFLTSHGSQESGIAVSNRSLPLNDVEPEALQRAFEASGIKWRIVIVSACYAGVFIEPLKSENTMVITAADADNTSFGCADDRDLTYFGEAFLRDALPKAPSLEAAFETARTAILKREKAEKLTPSNPQIFVGSAIREKLASLGEFPLAHAATGTAQADTTPIDTAK